MVSEIAFSPQVLGKPTVSARADWAEAIHTLGRRLKPDDGPSPVILSDLFDGWWYAELVREAREVDHPLRPKLQALATACEQLLVRRPPCRDQQRHPADELGWVLEAKESSQREPICFCLASTDVSREDVSGWELLRYLSQVNKPSTWNGISSQWQAPMVLQEQLQKLRPICLHSGYLVIINPYATGHEERFTTALIKQTLDKPAGFQVASVIDIHTTHKDRPTDLLAQAWEDKLQRLFHRKPAETTITLSFWPEGAFRDRILLAGDVGHLSSGERVHKPRWGVSMPHVVRPADQPDAAPSEWHLLPRESLKYWSRKFGTADGVQKPLRVITI